MLMLQASGAQLQLAPIQQVFVLMPLMHSEALADQDVSVVILLCLSLHECWGSRRVLPGTSCGGELGM